MPCAVARIYIVGFLVVFEWGVRVRRNCNILKGDALLTAMRFLVIKDEVLYGRLSDFSFYIDSQISVHRKFTK